MSYLFIRIYSGGWGVKFMKHFKWGGVSYKSLRTSDIGSSLRSRSGFPDTDLNNAGRT
jgi:hypothetical protein